MATSDCIAVITPNYNALSFLDQCIQTVKNQRTDCKIIHYIYDDCSTDGSKDHLMKYTDDPNIKIVFGNENKGQSFGRNTLIELALEDGCNYLAFLDIDDSWETNHIDTSLPFLNDNDIVYSYPKLMSEFGYEMFPIGFTIPKRYIGKLLLRGNYIWISTVVAKSEMFRNVKFDSELDSIEDWAMWVEQYRLGRKFIDKQVQTATYLIKANNQSAKGLQTVHVFNSKNKRLEDLKLNLGCGNDYQADYINLDLFLENSAKVDLQCDATELPFDDNTVDEIRAFNLIQCFDFHHAQHSLREWYRVLKPGGRLWIETPDFLSSCKEFIEKPDANKVELYDHFFSAPWIPGMTNKFLFTELQLITQLQWSGFSNINRLKSVDHDNKKYKSHLFLNIEAFK